MARKGKRKNRKQAPSTMTAEGKKGEVEHVVVNENALNGVLPLATPESIKVTAARSVLADAGVDEIMDLLNSPGDNVPELVAEDPQVLEAVATLVSPVKGVLEEDTPDPVDEACNEPPEEILQGSPILVSIDVSEEVKGAKEANGLVEEETTPEPVRDGLGVSPETLALFVIEDDENHMDSTKPPAEFTSEPDEAEYTLVCPEGKLRVAQQPPSGFAAPAEDVSPPAVPSPEPVKEYSKEPVISVTASSSNKFVMNLTTDTLNETEEPATSQVLLVFEEARKDLKNAKLPGPLGFFFNPIRDIVLDPSLTVASFVVPRVLSVIPFADGVAAAGFRIPCEIAKFGYTLIPFREDSK